MLTKRIIPCLDVKGGRVVKGIRFTELRDAGDPVEVAAAYDAQSADELCFLDITASHENRGTLLELVARTADRVMIPFSVGGGVRTADDVRALLQAGADKVSINTAAVERPDLVTEAADRLGSASLIVAIDARRREFENPGAGWEVSTRGSTMAQPVEVPPPCWPPASSTSAPSAWRRPSPTWPSEAYGSDHPRSEAGLVRPNATSGWVLATLVLRTPEPVC